MFSPFEKASDNASELDHRIDFLAEDLYQTAEALKENPAISRDDISDLCPLYSTISQITDRYQSPELIGRGGMKEVFRVYDAKTARHVALARPQEKYSKDHYDAFLREAHVTARLEHPCIIDLYDMGVDDEGRPFFTMEFKRGRSLREVIDQLSNGREKDIPIRTRLILFARICNAIAYAHSRRVIHLDIKPSNIQIGEFGEAQVCDWGLGIVTPGDDATDDSAVLLDPDLYGPLVTGVKGTPAYMSPEQRAPNSFKTPQMDIYALGCVLYEMIALKSYNKHGTNLSGVSAALAAIIRKAVATDPADRYRNVTAMHDDVMLSLAGFSNSAQPKSLIREIRLFGKRHRESSLVVLAAAVVISLITGLAIRLSQERFAAVQARTDAENARRNATVDRDIAMDERFKAESAFSTAQAAQKEAETASLNYLNEVEKTKRLLNLLRVKQINQATSRASDISLITGKGLPNSIQKSIAEYDQLIETRPPADSPIWDNLFWLHFSSQDFVSAVEIVDLGVTVSEDMARLAKRYKPLLNNQGYLDTDDFSKLISELCPDGAFRSNLTARMLVYDQKHARTIGERTRIVRAWIKLDSSNRGPSEIKLLYDPETNFFRLSGPVRRLRKSFYLPKVTPLTVNCLDTLNPVNLDLRDSEITNLEELEGLDLMEIDLRKTSVTDLEPLIEMRALRRIHVDEGQFRQEQIDSLNGWAEVFVHPKTFAKDGTNDSDS